MTTIALIVSDLHLADSTSIFESFGERQQAAFDGLLRVAAATSAERVQHSNRYAPYHTSPTPFHQADTVELIINGDCFDFLVTTPYEFNGVIDVKTALYKLEKIILAHTAFFTSLRAFLASPGRTITFISGNHDLELSFAEVRERICMAIVGTASDERIHFCPTRFYRPFPDVYVEHGNYYDFWNHAMLGIWDEQGQPVTRSPQSLLLPAGSRYWQHASYLISERYPYFDHFEPSINITRQVALLCLLAPELLVEATRLTVELFSKPYSALATIAPEQYSDPVQLYGAVMLDFMAFQEDTVANKQDWLADAATMEVSPETLQEFFMVRDALSLPLAQAVAMLCTPATYTMGEDVARGMHKVLTSDSTLRYAIAGHTHMQRIEPVNAASQVYLNPASWTTRLAQPAPEDFSGVHSQELLTWLRHPHMQHPLRDVTQFAFVLLSADNGPTSANLCVLEDETDGTYRVLGAQKE